MDDLISRQAAINTVSNWLRAVFGVNSNANTIGVFRELQELPSAQPETPSYVAEIESEYKKWVSMPHINKPLAKALYEVWKKHDREDVSRNG